MSSICLLFNLKFHSVFQSKNIRHIVKTNAIARFLILLASAKVEPKLIYCTKKPSCSSAFEIHNMFCPEIN